MARYYIDGNSGVDSVGNGTGTGSSAYATPLFALNDVHGTHGQDTWGDVFECAGTMTTSADMSSSSYTRPKFVSPLGSTWNCNSAVVSSISNSSFSGFTFTNPPSGSYVVSNAKNIKYCKITGNTLGVSLVTRAHLYRCFIDVSGGNYPVSCTLSLNMRECFVRSGGSTAASCVNTQSLVATNNVIVAGSSLSNTRCVINSGSDCHLEGNIFYSSGSNLASAIILNSASLEGCSIINNYFDIASAAAAIIQFIAPDMVADIRGNRWVNPGSLNFTNQTGTTIGDGNGTNTELASSELTDPGNDDFTLTENDGSFLEDWGSEFTPGFSSHKVGPFFVAGTGWLPSISRIS